MDLEGASADAAGAATAPAEPEAELARAQEKLAALERMISELTERSQKRKAQGMRQGPLRSSAAGELP